MCNKIRISVLLLFISTTLALKANEKKDTIKISLPNNTAVEVISIDVNKYKLDTAFICKNINQFLKFNKNLSLEKELEKGPKSIQITSGKGDVLWKDSAYVKSGNRLKIKAREITDEILLVSSSDKAVYYRQRHKLEFENEAYTINIYFDEIYQLKEVESKRMLMVIDSVLSEYYGEKSRFIEIGNFIVNNDYSIKQLFKNIKHVNDEIEFSFSSGLESAKNTFVTNLEVSMAFNFRRKGILKNRFGMSYEWQYDFSEGMDRNINHFMNLYYGRNFTKDPDKEKYYEFRIGYLLNKDGDLYKDDTFSFSVIRPVGKGFEIAPKIYFEGAFKNVAPAFGIKYNF